MLFEQCLCALVVVEVGMHEFQVDDWQHSVAT